MRTAAWSSLSGKASLPRSQRSSFAARIVAIGPDRSAASGGEELLPPKLGLRNRPTLQPAAGIHALGT
jgi:hypothetical protein